MKVDEGGCCRKATALSQLHLTFYPSRQAEKLTRRRTATLNGLRDLETAGWRTGWWLGRKGRGRGGPSAAARRHLLFENNLNFGDEMWK